MQLNKLSKVSPEPIPAKLEPSPANCFTRAPARDYASVTRPSATCPVLKITQQCDAGASSTASRWRSEEGAFGFVSALARDWRLASFDWSCEHRRLRSAAEDQYWRAGQRCQIGKVVNLENVRRKSKENTQYCSLMFENNVGVNRWRYFTPNFAHFVS